MTIMVPRILIIPFAEPHTLSFLLVLSNSNSALSMAEIALDIVQNCYTTVLPNMFFGRWRSRFFGNYLTGRRIDLSEIHLLRVRIPPSRDPSGYNLVCVVLTIPLDIEYASYVIYMCGYKCRRLLYINTLNTIFKSRNPQNV